MVVHAEVATKVEAKAKGCGRVFHRIGNRADACSAVRGKVESLKMNLGIIEENM